MITDTTAIIKFLPFEEDFKKLLLERFENASGQQKFDLDSMIWKAYYQVYEAQLQNNIQLALTEKEGSEIDTLDENFYTKIREKTEKEMEQMVKEESNNADISAAREAMEKIVKEIQASKQ